MWRQAHGLGILIYLVPLVQVQGNHVFEGSYGRMLAFGVGHGVCRQWVSAIAFEQEQFEMCLYRVHTEGRGRKKSICHGYEVRH